MKKKITEKDRLGLQKQIVRSISETKANFTKPKSTLERWKYNKRMNNAYNKKLDILKNISKGQEGVVKTIAKNANQLGQSIATNITASQIANRGYNDNSRSSSNNSLNRWIDNMDGNPKNTDNPGTDGETQSGNTAELGG